MTGGEYREAAEAALKEAERLAGVQPSWSMAWSQIAFGYIMLGRR